MRATTALMHRFPRASGVVRKLAAFYAWRDQVRNPSLSVLLVLQIFLMFVALPLDAMGVPIAKPLGQSLLILVLTVVVMLSHRGVAIAMILLGLVSTISGFALGEGWSPLASTVLSRGGMILVFLALTWVVAYSVYAPGRITCASRRRDASRWTTARASAATVPAPTSPWKRPRRLPAP